MVCTHFLPTRLIALLLRRGVTGRELIVVTTDYDFQGLWLSRPFTESSWPATRQGVHGDIGVPADRVTTSGIPVKPAFGESVDRDPVHKRYGLDRDADAPDLGRRRRRTYTKAIVKQTMRMQTPSRPWWSVAATLT